MKGLYLTVVFKADSLSEEERISLVEKCSAASWSHAIDERKALETEVERLRTLLEDQQKWMSHIASERDQLKAEIERYSMSAGAADQFRREALAMREALGFDKYGDDIAPVDLLNALDNRDAEVIERAAKYVWPDDNVIAKGNRLLLSDCANQLRQQSKGQNHES